MHAFSLRPAEPVISLSNAWQLHGVKVHVLENNASLLERDYASNAPFFARFGAVEGRSGVWSAASSHERTVFTVSSATMPQQDGVRWVNNPIGRFRRMPLLCLGKHDQQAWRTRSAGNVKDFVTPSR